MWCEIFFTKGLNLEGLDGAQLHRNLQVIREKSNENNQHSLFKISRSLWFFVGRSVKGAGRIG